MKRILFSMIFLFGGAQGCPALMTRAGVFPDRITVFYNPPLLSLTFPLKSSLSKLIKGESYEDLYDG